MARTALIRSTTASLLESLIVAAVVGRGRRPRLQKSSERAAEILEPIETFFDDVDARRVTHANYAIVAKRRAGHDRDIGFTQ